MEMNKEKSIDSKYVQQHLANERTFLAWIRTGITISGLGFLSIGVVFRSSMFASAAHSLAAACINQETFQAPKLIIWILLL